MSSCEVHQDEAIQRNPDYWVSYMGLSAGYYLTGDLEKSRWAAENVLRLNPKFSVAYYEKRTPMKIEEEKKWIYSVLYKAFEGVEAP